MSQVPTSNPENRVKVNLKVEGCDSKLVHRVRVQLSSSTESNNQVPMAKSQSRLFVYPAKKLPFRPIPLTARSTNRINQVKPSSSSRNGIYEFFHLCLEKITNFFKKLQDISQRNGRRAFGLKEPIVGINSIHFLFISIEKAELLIEIGVKNVNVFPLELLRSKILFGIQGCVPLTLDISNNTLIRPNSLKSLQFPLTIYSKDIIGESHEVVPGRLHPFTLKVESLFKEYFPIYGTYKTLVESTGEMPIPRQLRAKLQTLSFEYKEDGSPLVKLHLALSNDNTFELEITKLYYEVSAKETKVLVAKGINEANLSLGQSTCRVMEIELVPLHDSFGSAIWDIFSSNGTTDDYVILSKVDADSSHFGRLHIEVEVA